MQIQKRQVGTSIEEWSTERGGLRAERLGRQLLVFRARGHLAADLVELFERQVTAMFDDGAPHVFFDGTEMSGYDSEFRLRIAKYLVSVRDRAQSLNVYTPHRMVAMGAAVVNVAVGGVLSVFDERASFERALEQARSGARR
ncbi:hypothetical protein [Sandaracinus amylolyticus]|uniref:hypothetical protein n=1 Tax=Sandaracinus amylolyticus TaxID=927083 RepID=UPI001F372F00|nr:hypothetical protein [Sandaracinus amylolyticus]UJR85395.1 Hypothetical protein I5071_74750 [Sandaracinus amylolyticus]